MKRKYIDIILIIFIFAIMITIIVKTPIIVKYANNGKLIINEVLPKNKTVYEVENNYYDYIELYNGYDYDIDLDGYHLSDDSMNLKKYTFPSGIKIKAQSYLLVYASGLDKVDNGIIHTNFKLDDKGEVLTLSDENAKVLSRIYYQETLKDISYGYNGREYVYFYNPTPALENTGEYSKECITELKDNQETINLSNQKEIIINEVTSIPVEAIELKNTTNKDIKLDNYRITDKSNTFKALDDYTIKANSYLTLYEKDLGFSINSTNEEILLYKGEIVVDKLYVGKIVNGVSVGLNNEGHRVFYKNITLNKENADTYYLGYVSGVDYSVSESYVAKGTSISLSSDKDSTIYYTLDGSFPNNTSNVYKEPITINENTVIKAIAYKDNYIESDITSHTYTVDRMHTLPVVSISTNNSNLYGPNGIITKYYQNTTRMISFEYYVDNKLAISFIGDTKLAGMDSRLKPQKSMSIYLRKEYGKKEITYPLFGDVKTYQSFLLRNAGEDPKNIRIMDAVLSETLKGNMDIDIENYQPVVVYINGSYNGIYNLRDKLNGDYIETYYDIDKDEIDLIKYKTATKGNVNDYNNLVNYIASHNLKDSNVYEYVKSKIDIQELINYVIAESYYGNTDLGNIRYWRAKEDGKWRFMFYDLDWSMWNSNTNMSYPVVDMKVPAATSLKSLYVITRNLYKNPEFKDLYLKTLAYHLKNTFVPERMNSIVDKLAKEIENEMPYHIARWPAYNLTMNKWYSNINKFKNMIELRYKTITSRLKKEFGLTKEEYNKYFGDLNE